jgi:hypothetical protein
VEAEVLSMMDPHIMLTQADEQAWRAARAGFARAGLSRAQFSQAEGWFRDVGHQLSDPDQRAASFAEYAAARRWPVEAINAAVVVYGDISAVGPDAYLGPAPTPEEDAATVVKASELLRADPARYWRDVDLQEAWREALQRQEAVKAQIEASPTGALPASAVAPPARDVDQRRYDEITDALRDPVRAQRYWSSPSAQAEFRDVISRLGEATAAIDQGASVGPASLPEGTAP